MNETFKKILINNAGALFIASCTLLLAICSFVLSIRADLNSTQFQVQAIQSSISTLNSLPPEVASIKQLSQDTNQKVNLLYSSILSK